MAFIEPLRKTLKDGTLVVLRSPVPDDADGILETMRIYAEENQYWDPGEFQKNPDEARKQISEIRESESGIVVIAEVAGQIVGDIRFVPGTRKRSSHVGEYGLGLRPEWRGRGLGSMLVRTMIDWARSNPRIEKINLHTLSTNPEAIELNRKFGFVEEGRISKEVKFSDGSYADGVLMGLHLRSQK